MTLTVGFVFLIHGDGELSFLWHFNRVATGYYKEVNREELLKVGFDSMLKSLGDKYTEVLDDGLIEDLKGESAPMKINLSFSETDGVYVDTLDEESTYYVAGLRPGDVILEVNGESFENLTLEQVQQKATIINGSRDIIMKVRREDKTLIINVDSKARKKAAQSNVSASTILTSKGAVGYINYEIFSIGSYKDFKARLEELEETGIKALILDLRDNPGGNQKDAEKIASLFIDGRKVILKQELRNKTKEVYSSMSEGRDYPIIILVDGNSASCSEVLTAALKAHTNTTIIGSKTFGKGVGQKVFICNGYKYKYTVDYWYTPTGESIQGVGIEPDIKVEEGQDAKILAIEELEKIL